MTRRRTVRFSRHFGLGLAIVLISGCAASRPVVPLTPLAQRLPATLLTCSERPAPGALERQSDVAAYVVDLDAAGEDCRRKLGAIKNMVDVDASGS